MSTPIERLRALVQHPDCIRRVHVNLYDLRYVLALLGDTERTYLVYGRGAPEAGRMITARPSDICDVVSESGVVGVYDVAARRDVWTIRDGYKHE